MEIVVFAINAVVIYLLADWLLTRLEKRRGEVFAQRQVIFFFIFLLLALISFNVIQSVFSLSPVQ
jgi:predicted PurR-regulated permease PerM